MRDLVLLLVVVLAFRHQSLKQRLVGPFDLSHALVVWVLEQGQVLALAVSALAVSALAIVWLLQQHHPVCPWLLPLLEG